MFRMPEITKCFEAQYLPSHSDEQRKRVQILFKMKTFETSRGSEYGWARNEVMCKASNLPGMNGHKHNCIIDMVLVTPPIIGKGWNSWRCLIVTAVRLRVVSRDRDLALWHMRRTVWWGRSSRSTKYTCTVQENWRIGSYSLSPPSSQTLNVHYKRYCKIAYSYLNCLHVAL